MKSELPPSLAPHEEVPHPSADLMAKRARWFYWAAIAAVLGLPVTVIGVVVTYVVGTNPRVPAPVAGTPPRVEEPLSTPTISGGTPTLDPSRAPPQPSPPHDVPLPHSEPGDAWHQRPEPEPQPEPEPWPEPWPEPSHLQPEPSYSSTHREPAVIRTPSGKTRPPSRTPAATPLAPAEPAIRPLAEPTPLPGEWTYEETVNAEIRERAKPAMELALPEVPDSLRPRLAGKGVRLVVIVGVDGTPTVDAVYTQGVPRFIAQRVVDEVLRTPWRAARDTSGQPVADRLGLAFHWP